MRLFHYQKSKCRLIIIALSMMQVSNHCTLNTVLRHVLWYFPFQSPKFKHAYKTSVIFAYNREVNLETNLPHGVRSGWLIGWFSNRKGTLDDEKTAPWGTLNTVQVSPYLGTVLHMPSLFSCQIYLISARQPTFPSLHLFGRFVALQRSYSLPHTKMNTFLLDTYPSLCQSPQRN